MNNYKAINMKFFLSITLLISISCTTINHKSDNLLSYDKILSGYHYPFKTETFFFKSQEKSLQMTYMDVGPKNSQKIALLLHGKNFAGYYWLDTANLLVSHGYRVIIPDQIGFGKSSKPESYQFSFYQWSLNSFNLLDSLSIGSFTIVGHSMGGMLATHMTYDRPNRIKKMILINPIGLEPYLKYAQYKDSSFFYEMELKKTPEKFREYQRKNYYDDKWLPAYEELLLPHIGQMTGPDWKKVAWNNALTYGPIFTEDITRLFPEIRNSVRLIIGTRDKTGPGRGWLKEGVKYKLGEYKKLALKTKISFPNAKLYTLEGLGHMPQFEDFSRFRAVFIEALK